MRHSKIISAGLLSVAVVAIGGCVDDDDLSPPSIVQFSCRLEPARPSVSVVIDTGLGTARWMNLETPRTGQARISEHQYDIEFPSAGGAPATRFRINRYDGKVQHTTGTGRETSQIQGQCVKEKAGPRL